MMTKLSFFFVFVVVGYFVLMELVRKSRGSYVPKNLLTENEKEFYLRLKRALPGYDVFPQVAMGAILNPGVDRYDRRYYRIRATFAQKIVDYVICESNNLEVVAVVELDDRTHNAARDQARDAMLESAGYRVVRWDSRRKPSVQEIQQTIMRVRE